MRQDIVRDLIALVVVLLVFYLLELWRGMVIISLKGPERSVYAPLYMLDSMGTVSCAVRRNSRTENRGVHWRGLVYYCQKLDDVQ